MNDTPAPEKAPLGVIATDRPCARCGFNLHGQVIEREPHYGLVIARCPECGQVAALQEYPSLGRWARRWAGLLGAFWVIVVLLATIPTAAIFGASTDGAVRSAGYDLGQHIANEQADWLNSEQGLRARRGYAQLIDNTDSIPGTAVDPDPAFPGIEYLIDPTWVEPSQVISLHPWREVSGAWIRDRGIDAIIADAGGRSAFIDASTVWTWIGQFFACAGVGVFWSIALPGLRLWVRLLLVSIPASIGLVITVASLSDVGLLVVGVDFTGGVRPYDLGIRGMTPLVLPISAACCIAGLIVGSVAGRPLARAIIRWALPARLTAPFAGLWTVDGKALPRPRPQRQAS